MEQTEEVENSSLLTEEETWLKFLGIDRNKLHCCNYMKLHTHVLDKTFVVAAATLPDGSILWPSLNRARHFLKQCEQSPLKILFEK